MQHPPAHVHPRASPLARSLAMLLLLAPVFWTAACTTPSPPRTLTAPASDPVAHYQTRLAGAPKKDKTLWQYRLAASAIRRGESGIAKAALDDALARAAANYGAPNPDAAKSRKLTGKESDKPFIGEPYERVMANFYRAILYWADGEPDNARALFRTAQLLDSDTDHKAYAGDYILLDYLDGLITARLAPHDSAAGAAALALARARANAAAQIRPALPDYDPAANVFILVEYGDGPRKCFSGKDGARLAYFLPRQSCRFARLRIDGRVIEMPPWDDIDFQANTRGSRLMDEILARKNSLKTPFKAAGNTLLRTGVAIASVPWWAGADDIKSGIVQYGLAATVAAASAPFYGVAEVISRKSKADIRCWHNLPRFVSFAALKLPPGCHMAELVYYDTPGGNVVLTQHLEITVPAPAAQPSGAAVKDVVIFRSQLRN